ncbi:cytochrome c oxidase assembly protein PET191 [Gamsiella multidivaricata]|uniref:cytochrome c oxidase assembly protein PET191 n=1 Tax=Gamsiella multidivaricata TaxID=101098 RepID=UPI002220E693|nr:cytochrome c oxidase assembly protein PET191 [Gamsiella multidivaricata]KAI7817476.1 cytochrome c oxidase assembly protein PET191 [Gamsiella multidivaricata]
MPSSCKELRAELVECVLKSNCVLVDGLTPQECLRAENEYRVPAECAAIKRSFFECRRGMLDMRNRFRGNKS